MKLEMPANLVKPLVPKFRTNWELWEKKNFNIHRGVIEFTAPSLASIHDLARDVREGVVAEFRPGWFRGFGFGTIVRMREVPADFGEFCRHIDRTTRTGGVWQWAVFCLETEKTAFAVHTWQHGYLRPVYDSVLGQLATHGYRCHASDADTPWIFTLAQKM